MTERRDARGIALHRWPEADRLVWEELVRPGNVIDGAGPFANLRQATLEKWRNAYGFFLGHLRRIGVDLDAEPPAERATLDHLRAFAGSISNLAAWTQAGYFEGVHAVLTAAYPARDWSRLTAAKHNLRRRANNAPRARRAFRAVTGDVLLELGQSMLAEARDKAGPIDIHTAELWRDGLMIAFLAAHPMRIVNFALLEIGTTIRKKGPDYRVAIHGTASKNHRPFDFSVAPLIAAELDAYLEVCRPVFPGGTSSDSGRLWLAMHGQPWSHKSAGRRISARTEQRLGIRVTPHQFRHAAATTLALAGGSCARLAKALLTHATPDLAERVYSQATQLDASREYAKVLEGLRREARRKRGRRPCAL